MKRVDPNLGRTASSSWICQASPLLRAELTYRAYVAAGHSTPALVEKAVRYCFSSEGGEDASLPGGHSREKLLEKRRNGR